MPPYRDILCDMRALMYKKRIFFPCSITVLVTLFDANRGIGTNILKEDQNLFKELQKSER